MSERVVYSLKRHNGDELRLTVGSYNGKPTIQLRDWYDSNGEMRPSKKGVSLPLQELAAIASALEEAISVVERKPRREDPL